MAETFDAGEDGVGGFGPDERVRTNVGVVDVAVDRALKIVGPFEGAALHALAGETCEPALVGIRP
ncbi:hypothetical protein MKK88_00235 [Methylobacterium sp. E-005]|uniref:hypothetical protein n=1 Tax=Methylobacterium sp. E-005 TaxID=2836549 RepID=UPI001FBA5B5F|nr:hypothetical protein [Methylobacterium sp. E-005]MCJ2084424.1 hypothetical protein [Methylobacterium sp. E-005]